MTVTLPDALAAKVADLPGLNVSGVLQEALWAVVECRHSDLACRCCGRPVAVADLKAEALTAFYRDLMHRLGLLIQRGGTAEGAARIVGQLAETHHFPAPIPVSRPTRAERQINNDGRWLREQRA